MNSRAPRACVAAIAVWGLFLGPPGAFAQETVNYSSVSGRVLDPQGALVPGTNNGCRPVAVFRNNNQYSSVASSNYHGLHLSFVQRTTNWASVRVTERLALPHTWISGE